MRRKRTPTDEGFTLVETIVSLAIISLTLVGSLYFASGYFRTSHDVFSRTKGVQLASEQVESLRSIPWTSLGLFSSEYPSPYPTCPGSCAGETAVTLTGTRAQTPLAPSPSQRMTRGAIDYTITTYVTWARPVSTGGGDIPIVVKHVVVKVTWTASGRSLSAVSDGMRTPNYSERSSAISATASPAATPTPSASPTAAPPTGVPTIMSNIVSTQANAVSSQPICVVPTSATTSVTKYAETGTVTVNNATVNDDVSATWSGNPTVFYNTGLGAISGTSIVFTFQIPAGTPGSGSSTTSAPLTIVVTRATDGVQNATTDQTRTVDIKVSGC